MFCFEYINTSKKNIENIEKYREYIRYFSNEFITKNIFISKISKILYRRSTHDPTDAISFERREPTLNNLHILHIY